MNDFVRITAWVKPTTREALRIEAMRRRQNDGGGCQMADLAGTILDTAVEGSDWLSANEAPDRG